MTVIDEPVVSSCRVLAQHRPPQDRVEGLFALAIGLHEAPAADGSARVVAVGSSGHRRSPIAWDDANFALCPYDLVARLRSVQDRERTSHSPSAPAACGIGRRTSIASSMRPWRARSSARGRITWGSLSAPAARRRSAASSMRVGHTHRPVGGERPRFGLTAVAGEQAGELLSMVGVRDAVDVYVTTQEVGGLVDTALAYQQGGVQGDGVPAVRPPRIEGNCWAHTDGGEHGRDLGIAAVIGGEFHQDLGKRRVGGARPDEGDDLVDAALSDEQRCRLADGLPVSGVGVRAERGDCLVEAVASGEQPGGRADRLPPACGDERFRGPPAQPPGLQARDRRRSWPRSGAARRTSFRARPDPAECRSDRARTSCRV